MRRQVRARLSSADLLHRNILGRVSHQKRMWNGEYPILQRPVGRRAATQLKAGATMQQAAGIRIAPSAPYVAQEHTHMHADVPAGQRRGTRYAHYLFFYSPMRPQLRARAERRPLVVGRRRSARTRALESRSAVLLLARAAGASRAPAPNASS